MNDIDDPTLCVEDDICEDTQEWLQKIFEVRRSIGDPSTSDFIYVKKLPETALQNTAYTTGNGEYFFYDVIEWRKFDTKVSDACIGILINQHGRLRASIRLIDVLIAQIDPTRYITSGNAGGQSISRLSLQEVLNYYETLRNQLLEEEAAEAGMNSGLMLKTKKRPVGGVLEDE
jgi:hypothetical protein